ncbi:hypothetical protein ACI797_18030 [Geodermatophilus sp. SYSU D00691]
MISTTISFAPAWVPGTGSVVARPYACAAVRPSLLGALAAAQGTGVPSVAPTRRRGLVMGFEQALLPIQKHDGTTQNDGTTPLGIHSPGRPKS